VREVSIDAHCLLALAPREKRIWVHDRRSGMNLLIPITNYYNELMLRKRIRDPKIALRSDAFFEELDRYPDGDLREAFVAYNALRQRVRLEEISTIARPAPAWKRLLRAATGGRYDG
jgi:hypothetical protein